jgi:hypothetical protein
MPLPEEEIVLPFPVPKHMVRPVTRVRSGLISSSIVGLREMGCFDRYYALLPIEHRDRILGLTAAEWIDPQLAMIHYEACEALECSKEEQIKNGMRVAQRLQKGFLSVVLRAAQESGIGPWSVLVRYQRLWERYFDGSAIQVTKLGPKEARVELVGFPMARLVYIQNGVGGIMRGVTELVTKRVYATLLEKRCTRTSLTYQLSWA